MDKRKRLFFFITGALTLALTVCAVIFGINCHIRGLALADVTAETARITSENELLTTRRDILQSDVGSKTDDTERKDALNSEIAEKTGEIATMKSNIAAAQKATQRLSIRTAELNNSLTALNKGMNLKKGQSFQVGEMGLRCPTAINSGRYIATGDGIITIIAPNGSARVSEDLLSIDTGSYTFDLAEGEYVEADSGNVTLTELK